MTLTEFVFRGWKVIDPPDVCWLDCEDAGILEREHLGRHVTLCRGHAEDLERGFYHGDYSGAPLPSDSRATAWPWLPVERAA